MFVASRWRHVLGSLAVMAVVVACGDAGGGGAAADAVTRVIPTVLPPGVSVRNVNEEHPLPEDAPGAPFRIQRLVWFELDPQESSPLGLAILDLEAPTEDPSVMLLREATRTTVAGLTVLVGTSTGEGESGSPADLWFVRVTSRTWVLVSRDVAQRAELADRDVVAVIAGLRPVDDAGWDAYVRTVATTTTTVAPAASGSGGPTEGASGLDCMRTAAVLPPALRLWPDPLPVDTTVTVVALGPICGDLTTISVVPLSPAAGASRWIAFRITGSGVAPPVFDVPASSTVETVVAGTRTIRLAMFVLGAATPGAAGTFEEAGRVVAFNASGYEKADVLAMLATLRPATAGEWASAGGRS